MGARLSQLFQNLNTDEAKRSKALDELWAEFEKVKNNKNRLFEFHKKLRTLTFFDPACGCGKFLVIVIGNCVSWSWRCCGPAFRMDKWVSMCMG